MKTVKRACFALLALVWSPFLLSFCYSVWLTVHYSDYPRMTPEEAYRLASSTFPGKQIFWMAGLMVGAAARPFFWLKHRRRRKQRAANVQPARRYSTTEVQLPTALQDQLMTFLTEQTMRAPKSSYDVDLNHFYGS